MLQVHFLDSRGIRKTIAARGGTTLMEAAVQNGVEGIDAECGGACACATCHVYVDGAWVDRVGPPGTTEHELLDAMGERRRPESRLSCQIKVVEALDGLVVTTPAEQGPPT